MKSFFTDEVYRDTKRLFSEGAVQILVARPKFDPDRIAVDPTVRLVHTVTGTEVSCGEYSSQTENFVAAMIRLRIACDEIDA